MAEQKHTIAEIIGQCKLRWSLSDDFTPAELTCWNEAADTILSEVESESDKKDKVICCGRPITLDANWQVNSETFIGQCPECKKAWQLSDITAWYDEDETSDNTDDDTVYHCEKCEIAIGLSDFQAGDGKCVKCKNL